MIIGMLIQAANQQDIRMDGWMICHFMSILTVFQSYLDDGWVIMKGYVQLNSIYH